MLLKASNNSSLLSLISCLGARKASSSVSPSGEGCGRKRKQPKKYFRKQKKRRKKRRRGRRSRRRREKKRKIETEEDSKSDGKSDNRDITVMENRKIQETTKGL